MRGSKWPKALVRATHAIRKSAFYPRVLKFATNDAGNTTKWTIGNIRRLAVFERLETHHADRLYVRVLSMTSVGEFGRSQVDGLTFRCQPAIRYH